MAKHSPKRGASECLIVLANPALKKNASDSSDTKNISYNKHSATPEKGYEHPYKKFIIKDPFNNRKDIANIAKNKKGVYFFEGRLGEWSDKSKDLNYVGSSINLYNRVSSYFMPSVLAKSDRKVIRYFNKYGFKDVDLTLFIMDSDCTWNQVIELEQYFINTLKPNLNVDLIAGGYSGYHYPMSEKAKKKLRVLRGTPIYIYDTTSKSLIFISDSKQWLYDNLKIHHVSLGNCLSNGNLYLDRFFFSLDIISEFPFEAIMDFDELKILIEKTRLEYRPNQARSDARKTILAENILHPNLTKTYRSIGDLSRQLKGDRGTIRNYINGNKTGLYRGQWKFSLMLYRLED